MANLEFPIGSLEMTIYPSTLQVSKRLNVSLRLTISWLENEIHLENKNSISVTRQDIDRLTYMLRSFVQSRVNIDERKDEVDKSLLSTFTPMELGFTISCLDGDVDENFVGQITLRIMLNSDLVDYSYTSNYVGVEVNVNSSSLLEFCEMLEQETLTAEDMSS